MKFDKAKKNLGQNFLTDPNILGKIFNEIAPKEKETIIEIGSGHGALTELLSQSGVKIISFEIDTNLFNEVRNKIPNVNFVNEDFLKFNLADFKSKRKFRVVGNIPYNITSPIVFKLIENINLIKDAVFLIQKEVAERIIAKPRTKEYGILSVLLSYFADVKLAFNVSPNVFIPKPKVFSSVIHIHFKQKREDIDEELFRKIVKASFNYRRKTLKNSLLNSIFKNCNFENLDFDFNKRAEELSVADYVRLTKSLMGILNGNERNTATTA